MADVRAYLGFFVLIAASAGTLLSGGCASGQRTEEAARSTSATPRERLAQAAASEAALAPVAALASPPGVDAVRLASRAPTDPRALLSAQAALEDIAPLDEIPAPETLPDPPPAAREEALRHFLRGRDHMLEGEALAAVVELQRARELDPGAIRVLHELARAYAMVPNPNAALTTYQEILRFEPDASEAVLTHGLAAINRRDFREAVRLLARRRALGRPFAHDPAGDLLADFALHVAFANLGYDRASIDAGIAANGVTLPFEGRTVYRQRVGSLYRQRSEIWQAIGDAECRLGRYDAALDAYEASALLPRSDPSSLHTRVVYANLALGRPLKAQLELLAALRATAPAVPDRTVRLCEYLAAQAPEHEILAAAVVDLLDAHPDAAAVARAAAALAAPDDAKDILLGFVTAHPRDLDVVGQFLLWLGARSPEDAVELAASLVATEPDLAGDYVERLLLALPSPATAIELAAAGDDAAHVKLLVNLDLRLTGLGEAWQACERGLDRWPGDEGLRLLEIGVAGRLDEPALIAAACAAARDVTSARAAVVRAEAWRNAEAYDDALIAANDVIRLAAPGSREAVDARLEIARVRLAQAMRMEGGEGRRDLMRSAAEMAEAAQVLAPEREEAYALLAALYRPQGPLADAAAFQETVRALRRSTNGRLFERLRAQDDVENRRRFEDGLERALVLYESDPGDVESLALAVAAWRYLGRVDDAVTMLKERIKTHPGDVGALDQLVQLLRDEQRLDEALALLDRRRAVTGDDPALLRLLEMIYQVQGDWDRAVPMGERRLLARPEGSRRALQLALLYVQAGRPELAIAQLEQIAASADTASRRHLTGAVGLASGLVEREGVHALRALLVERLVAIEPGSAMAIYAAGLVSLAEIEPPGPRFVALAERAVVSAAGATDRSIQGALPWRELAQLLVNGGHAEAASQILRARLAAGLDGEAQYAPDALRLLTSMTTAADAAAADDDRSLALLVDLDERGIVPALPGDEDAPSLVGALSVLSRFYALVGDTDGSRRLLVEARRRAPDDAVILNDLGYMRIEAGRGDEETAALIESAADMSPDSASIVDTLGWLRYKQMRFEDEPDRPGAATMLARAIELSDEPSAEVLDHYGDVLWRVGRRDEAIDAWRQARAQLGDGHREEMVRNLQLYQQRVWGLVVADPAEMYDRDFGVVRERTGAKLAAAERGGEPPVAPTFSELGSGVDGGG